MKLKVIECNEKEIIVELPRKLFKGAIPKNITLNNFEWIY